MGRFFVLAPGGVVRETIAEQRPLKKRPEQRCIRRDAYTIFVACCLLLQTIAAAADRPVRRILIINAFSPSAPASVQSNEAIHTVLARSSYQIELYHEYLETVLFPNPSEQQKSRETLVEKYRDRKLDLIIAVSISSIRFMSESRERFFPNTPVVFCCGTEEIAANLKLDSQFAGVWMSAQPLKTLEAALKLQPGTRHVVVVGGAGKMDRLGEAYVKEHFRSYEAERDFTYLTDLTMPGLLERVRELPSHTIIFYTSFARDAAGTPFVDATQALPMIAAAANAPVFVTVDTFIGQGAVGGYVTSFAAQGHVAGEIALRILKGERPQDIPIVQGTNLYMFDWRALRRWGLKESNLPGGSTVLYRVPSAWELYKWQIETVCLFILGMVVLIAYLLFERKRRRSAEESLVRQFRFEGLISEISSEFVNLPATQAGSVLQRSLVRLREFLGVDRVSIFESADQGVLRLRHSTRCDGMATAPEELRKTDFPWFFERLVGTEPIVVSHLDELPDVQNEAREFFGEIGPREFVFFPLRVEESLVGAMSFVVTQPASLWSAELLPQLKALSQVWANALARELSQRALFESEARFRVMGDAAPAFIWMSDQEGKFIYLNKKTLEFTGARPGEMNGAGWAEFLHPDDLRAALEANARALQLRQRYAREYRVRRHDGVYRWMFDIGNPRLDGDGAFVGFIGSAIDITDQKLAQEALEKVGGQLIAAQEKERSHIARELHDDICQRLAMLSLRIERATKGWGRDNGAVEDQLALIWQQCSDLTGDVQALSHALHPSLLDNLGLVTAVRSFCRELTEHGGAEVKFTERGIPDGLSREVSLSLFRVVQEALHNAAKYSGGKNFEVNFRGTSDGVELEVWDDGVGFDVAGVKDTGLGLVSMRERIHLLNGTINIDSKVGAGTRIRVRVPVSASTLASSINTD
jgi:PAS domain S-box-containing protein